MAAVWRGKGVTPLGLAPGSYHRLGWKTRHGQSALPEPDGRIWIANGIYPGWQTGDRFSREDPREPAPSPEALGRVCHYIELNPVRAGIVPAEQLEAYRFGSFMRLWEPKRRPLWYEARTGLAAAGGLADSPKGRSRYREYLAWLDEETKQGREEEYQRLSEGWAIGSEGFVAELLDNHGAKVNDQTWDGRSKREWREGQWERHLSALLRTIPAKLRRDQRVSARWKAEAAWRMKTETDASNGWLAERLAMSTLTYVSKMVGLVRKKR